MVQMNPVVSASPGPLGARGVPRSGKGDPLSYPGGQKHPSPFSILFPNHQSAKRSSTRKNPDGNPSHGGDLKSAPRAPPPPNCIKGAHVWAQNKQVAVTPPHGFGGGMGGKVQGVGGEGRGGRVHPWGKGPLQGEPVRGALGLVGFVFAGGFGHSPPPMGTNDATGPGHGPGPIPKPFDGGPPLTMGGLGEGGGVAQNPSPFAPKLALGPVTARGRPRPPPSGKGL